MNRRAFLCGVAAVPFVGAGVGVNVGLPSSYVTALAANRMVQLKDVAAYYGYWARHFQAKGNAYGANVALIEWAKARLIIESETEEVT